jgi:hypothetical protein
MLSLLHDAFVYVNAFPTSVGIRESNLLYPAILTSHVLGMALFAGLVIMMDLRLLGIGNMHTPLSQLQKRTFPWQMFGMTVSTVTGLLLVYGQPVRFWGNIFFWLKMALIALAGVNALAFHLGTYRSVASWDVRAKLPLLAKVAGGMGLVLWGLVVISGRLIAYNWFE